MELIALLGEVCPALQFAAVRNEGAGGGLAAWAEGAARTVGRSVGMVVAAAGIEKVVTEVGTFTQSVDDLQYGSVSFVPPVVAGTERLRSALPRPEMPPAV